MGTSSVSRREILRLVAGATTLACTPRGEVPPAPRPGPQWPDGPAPEVVLAIDDGGSAVTWYADGLVLCERSGGLMMYGDETMKRSPELLLMRVDAGELVRLRALADAREVQDAAPDHAQAGVHDAAHLTIIAGGRRIRLRGNPRDLPEPLTRLQEAYFAALERADADAVDAFVAREPRLVVQHHRSLRARRFADQLIVFANGVLDYRVTMDVAEAGRTHPTLRIEQVPRTTLAPLLERLAALDRSDVEPHPPRIGDDATTGTSQLLCHGGRVPRIRTRPGRGVPEPLRPVLAALAELRGRFDAPPDEA